MDILAFALQKEIDAEAYYRELAAGAPTAGMTRIWTMLATAESRHQAVVKSMQEASPALPEVDVLDGARDAFAKLREDAAKSLPTVDEKQVALYETACAMEKAAADFYAEKAEEVNHPAQAETFRRLAGQEQIHYAMVTSLLEFVRCPEQWVESAEFSHILDQDRGLGFYPEKA